MTSVAGIAGGIAGGVAGVLWAVSVSRAAPLTLDIASPITLSESAADLAKTPPRAIALKVSEMGSSAVWNASEIRLSGMPMPDGDDATLVLRRMPSPIEATWLIGTDSAGAETQTPVSAPPVLLLSGSVDGEPDSAVFLGMYGDVLQGWIETDAGLHVISTPPEGGPTLLYRVGAERGGIDVPSPGASQVVPSEPAAAQGAATRFSPETDYDRLLSELQDPQSPLRSILSGEGARRLPDMLNRSAIALDPEVELGACCVMPGFCFQLPASLCADFCNEVGDTFCQQTWANGTNDVDFSSTPQNLPPCWLGPGVPCNEQWVCFEPDPDAVPGDESYGNWTGACCVQVPLGSGVYQVQDLPACECALQGGTFLISPAICLGEDLADPEKMPASNFVDAATILTIDPDICLHPSGACCIEQEVLCEDIADPANPSFDVFERVTCINVPESICADATIIQQSFNGTGGAGYFTKECFPCLFDPAAQGAWGSDFICPESMQKEPSGVGPPPQLACQSPRLTIDTDAWYLQRFDGDVQAAQAYAAMLMASMNYILKRDALVEFQIGDLLIRGGEVCETSDNGTPTNPDDDYLTCEPWDAVYYVSGACCFPTDGWCIDSTSESDCRNWGDQGYNVQWHGPGSSCWNESGTPCGASGDVWNDADSMWEIGDTLNAMTGYWGLTPTDANMVLLLSGYPYGKPYFANVPWPDTDEWEDTWGVEVQDVAVGSFRTLCVEGQRPYAVAAVKGTFPWPGVNFAPDNVNWDIVAVARALGMAIGVTETRYYGYDTCFGPPCEGVRVDPDCEHQFVYTGLYQGSSSNAGTSSMPATLMSFCYTCPGGAANIQLRFRSDMGARIYSRFASMDCSWSAVGGLDPAEPSTPYAADDLFTTIPGGPQLLDVLANDVAPGCFDQNTFDVDSWDPADWDPQEDPWPLFPMDVTYLGVWQNEPFDPVLPFDQWWDFVKDDAGGLPGLTILGGTIDIVEDPASPNGTRLVEYTPPAESCGIDVFQYRITTDPAGYVLPDGTPAPIPDSPADAIATVRIIENQCSVSKTISCNPTPPSDCPASGTQSPVPPMVPQADDADVIEIVDTAAAELTGFIWSDLMLGWDPLRPILAEDAFLRVWVASQPGAAADVYFEVYPFDDTVAACGPDDPYVPGSNPEAGPSSGTCAPLDGVYVPSDGKILVQCLQTVDAVPGDRDGWWFGGSFCIVSEPTNAIGACCVDGMCIETTAYDCSAMDWSWEWLPPSLTDPYYRWGWTTDRNASGFFHGAGTNCTERNWCRRTAPCCYVSPDGKPGCSLLTCDECRAIGGVMLTMAAGSNGTDYCDPADPWIPSIGPPQPLWDTECVYPVCNFENLSAYPLVPLNPPDPSGTTGACCVQAVSGEHFCTDLSRDDCEAYESDPLVDSTSWSIVARCDEVPCHPLGACCVDSGSGLLCVGDGMSEPECQAFWYGTPSNPPSQVVFRAGELCGAGNCNPSGTGACCLPDIGTCCDGMSKEVCDLVYGTFLGQGVSCNSCNGPSDPVGVCALSGSGLPVCTADLSESICVNSFAGTWYPDIAACSEGIPGLGMELEPLDQPAVQPDPGNPIGACCLEYDCVPQVRRFDCLLAGGRFLTDTDNPYANSGGCPPTQGSWFGRCCLSTAAWGQVCVKLNRLDCHAEGGTYVFGTDCTSLCGVEEMRICAPGVCQITLDDPGQIGGGGIVIQYITADDAGCLAQDGRWLGYTWQDGVDAGVRAYTGHIEGDISLFRRHGDLDGDGRVGATDVLRLFGHWGSADSRADLDESGRVDVDDLRRLLSQWD